MSQGFEDRAADWIRFVRTEGHDAYWAYREAFFEILPSTPARALEIGCGEGRVSRDLRSRAYDVTGLDVAPMLADAARNADRVGRTSSRTPPRCRSTTVSWTWSSRTTV